MLSPDKLLEALKKGVDKANDLNVKATIVISDLHGNILASLRMEGAFAVSPIFATSKAVTSGTLGFPTSELAKYAGEGKPYNGIDNLSAGRFTTMAGGVPVMKDEKLIAGVGVGGASDTSLDVEIAKAVAEAL